MNCPHFAQGGKAAQGVARSRFAALRGALADPSGSLFHFLYDWLALRVIVGEPARAVK
jgi:hypothetical protein